MKPCFLPVQHKCKTLLSVCHCSMMMFPREKVCRMLGHNLGMFWQPWRLGTETKVSIEVSRALGRDGWKDQNVRHRFKQDCDYQYKCYIWPRSACDHKSDSLLFRQWSLHDTSTRAACFKRAATSENSSPVHQLATGTRLFCSLIFRLSLLKAQSATLTGICWQKMGQNVHVYVCSYIDN